MNTNELITKMIGRGVRLLNNESSTDAVALKLDYSDSMSSMSELYSKTNIDADNDRQSESEGS